MTKLLLISLLLASGNPFSPGGDFAPGSDSQPAAQGIEGTVRRVGGNLMPAPHVKPAIPPGVRATIYIFDLTNISQVTRSGQSGYYSAIHTPLVSQADTDEKGYFKVGLPAGHYSIFTKKGDLFYASRMDDKNNIAPVEVPPHIFTKVDCRIESDHKATY
jgi:hypothetical protein